MHTHTHSYAYSYSHVNANNQRNGNTAYEQCLALRCSYATLARVIPTRSINKSNTSMASTARKQ